MLGINQPLRKFIIFPSPLLLPADQQLSISTNHPYSISSRVTLHFEIARMPASVMTCHAILCFLLTHNQKSSKSYFFILFKKLVSVRFMPSALESTKKNSRSVSHNLFFRQDPQSYFTNSVSSAYVSLKMHAFRHFLYNLLSL